MYNTRFIMSDGSVIYPAYLDKEDKEKLHIRQGKQREYLRCGCRLDKNLYYRLSEDLKFYPEHNNYEHDKYCCRYRENGKNRRITAYMYDDSSDEITAFCSFNPRSFSDGEKNYPDDNEQEETSEELPEGEIIVEGAMPEKGDVKEKKEPKLGMPELIRSLNVDTFTDAVMHNIKPKSRDSFSKSVYKRMRHVRIAKMKKPIGELSLETDGVRFVYLKYADTYEQTEKGYTKCYIDTLDSDGKTYRNLVHPDALRKAVKAFVKAYGIEPDGNTMIAGFQYVKKGRSGYTYRIIGRLHIFQVSSNGIYSRTLAEQGIYNALEDIVSKNRDIWYMIPPEDPNVAAIVYVEGQPKSLVLAVRSKADQVISYDTEQYVLGVADNPDMITADSIRQSLQ